MIVSNTHRRIALRAATGAGVLAMVALLAACALPSRGAPRTDGSSGLYERSTHRLARAPEHAAVCIAEHARTGGRAAEMVPLYGLESVALTVKTSASGDLLAVFSLTRADAGSVAATTTWAGAVPDREAFVRELVQGC
jgi:hypothetical protein